MADPLGGDAVNAQLELLTLPVWQYAGALCVVPDCAPPAVMERKVWIQTSFRWPAEKLTRKNARTRQLCRSWDQLLSDLHLSNTLVCQGMRRPKGAISTAVDWIKRNYQSKYIPECVYYEAQRAHVISWGDGDL